MRRARRDCTSLLRAGAAGTPQACRRASIAKARQAEARWASHRRLQLCFVSSVSQFGVAIASANSANVKSRSHTQPPLATMNTLSASSTFVARKVSSRCWHCRPVLACQADTRTAFRRPQASAALRPQPARVVLAARAPRTVAARAARFAVSAAAVRTFSLYGHFPGVRCAAHTRPLPLQNAETLDKVRTIIAEQLGTDLDKASSRAREPAAVHRRCAR